MGLPCLTASPAGLRARSGIMPPWPRCSRGGCRRRSRPSWRGQWAICSAWRVLGQAPDSFPRSQQKPSFGRALKAQNRSRYVAAASGSILVQFGYRTTLQNDPYPRAFPIGGFYNNGHYADPLLNTAGQNRILAAGVAKTDVGASELYIQGQQMVYRPDMSTDRGLTVFGRCCPRSQHAEAASPTSKGCCSPASITKGYFPNGPTTRLGSRPA
jgi:carbohydrate-selective porin OprB